MRKFVLIIVLLFLSCQFYGQEVLELGPSEEGTVEQKPESPKEVISVKSSTFSDIEYLWSQVIDQIERGEWNYASDGIMKIKQIKNELGIAIIPYMSHSLVMKGNEQLNRHEWKSASRLFLGAVDLDPTNLEAYLGLARSSIKQNASGILKSLYYLSLSIPNRFLTIISSIQFIDSAANKLFLIIFFVSIAFGLTLLIKYWELLYHDLGEKYSNEYTGDKIKIILLLILIFPLLIFIGWGWIFIYWCILLWGYSERWEKLISGILIFFIFMWVPTLQFLNEVKEASLDNEILAYHGALYEKLLPITIKRLQDEALKGEERKWAKLLLAEQLKKSGDYPSAISVYNEILNKDSANIKALNNLANTYYNLDMLEDAVKYYEKAIELNPSDATLYYNYSLAVRSQFNFTKADDLLMRAQSLDLNLILSYENRPADKKGVVDFTLKPSELVKLLFRKTAIGKNYLNAVWMFINPVSIIIIVMVIVINAKMKKFYYAKKCVSCGIPFCKRCQAVERMQRYCSQCFHLFVKKDGVAQSSKNEKIEFINRWKKKRNLRSYLLNMIIPGSGTMYMSGIKSGIIAVIIWAFLISMLFSYQWKIMPYLLSNFNIWLSLYFVVLLIIYYIIFNIIIIIKPRKAD